MKTDTKVTLKEMNDFQLAQFDKAQTMWEDFLNKTPDQLGGSISEGNRIYEKIRTQELNKISKETGVHLLQLAQWFLISPTGK